MDVNYHQWELLWVYVCLCIFDNTYLFDIAVNKVWWLRNTSVKPATNLESCATIDERYVTLASLASLASYWRLVNKSIP